LSTDGRIFGDQSLTPLLGQPAFAQEGDKAVTGKRCILGRLNLTT
jgi:hypothetical protein